MEIFLLRRYFDRLPYVQGWQHSFLKVTQTGKIESRCKDSEFLEKISITSFHLGKNTTERKIKLYFD
jgi:hypothetical protein